MIEIEGTRLIAEESETPTIRKNIETVTAFVIGERDPIAGGCWPTCGDGQHTRWRGLQGE